MLYRIHNLTPMYVLTLSTGRFQILISTKQTHFLITLLGTVMVVVQLRYGPVEFSSVDVHMITAGLSLALLGPVSPEIRNWSHLIKSWLGHHPKFTTPRDEKT